MKIVALTVLSFIAGWIGLIYGMVLSGLAVHASDFSLKDIDALVFLCGIGAVFAFLGRFIGSKIGWIPAAVYCAPIVLLGGLLAGAFSKWDSVIAAGACTVVCAIVYWLANLWVAANKPNQSPEPIPLTRDGSP